MNENIKPSKLWMNATLTHEKIEIIIILSLNFNLLIKFEFGSSLHGPPILLRLKSKVASSEQW
jgi:hypothetical protein